MKYLAAKIKKFIKLIKRLVTDFIAILFFIFLAFLFVLIFHMEPSNTILYSVHVTCYSGADIIYEGDTKYIVFNSNYTLWRDIKTGKKIKTTAHCLAKW